MKAHLGKIVKSNQAALAIAMMMASSPLCAENGAGTGGDRAERAADQACASFIPACEDIIVMAFFDWDQSDLRPDAAATLDTAIQRFRSDGCPYRRVTLSGHTDRAGPADYNLERSARMVNAVWSYLVANGIPAEMIELEAHGESIPMVATEDGIRDAMNRRVEVTMAIR